MARVVKCALLQVGSDIPMTEPVEVIRAAMNQKCAGLIANAARQGTQILVLPELFTMPYFARFTDSRWYAAAEPIPNGPTISLMRDLARRYAMVIVAPIYELDRQARYNSAAVIDADGKYLGVYRKHHVPTYHTGNYEPFYFHQPDLGFPVFDTAYARIGIYICYDRHFPEVARIYGVKGAEIVFNPSATGGKNSERVWELEQQAYALHNGYFLAALNRVGRGEPFDVGKFFGKSYFCNPFGEIIAQGGKGTEEIVIADLDLDEIARTRDTWHTNRLYIDRRPTTYLELFESVNQTDTKTPKEAKDRLMDRFGLSDEQAQAILEMRLQRLTNLEQRKIVEEYEETIKLINRLKALLASERLMLNLITEELVSIRDAYGDERRTEIVESAPEIKVEDLIAEEDMVVTITHTGYIKRNAISLYRSQHRGGKGKVGINVKEEDFVVDLFIASTHDYILFFTDLGKIHWKKVHELPQAGRATRGKAIVNLLNLGSEEKVTTILPLKDFSRGGFITFMTKRGTIKKTALEAYSNPRAGGIIAISLDEEDELISAKLTDGQHHLFIGTKLGKGIHFPESQIREMGRTARGIRGIKLSKGDEVMGMEVVTPHTQILTVASRGYGKRTKASEYRIQNRGGTGIFTVKRTQKTGDVVGIKTVADEDELMLISNKGKILRLQAADIPIQGRSTQGVRLISIEEGEWVVGIARLAEKE